MLLDVIPRMLVSVRRTALRSWARSLPIRPGAGRLPQRANLAVRIELGQILGRLLLLLLLWRGILRLLLVPTAAVLWITLPRIAGSVLGLLGLLLCLLW